MLIRNRDILLLLKNILIIIFVILAGALGVLFFEYKANVVGDNVIKDFFDAIWWSLVTITTVGYGDLYPVTFWGRIIGIVFILLGFIAFSTFTAFIASTFIDKKIKESKGLGNIKGKNHIMICGWNNSAYRILDLIMKIRGKEVPTVILVNEMDEGFINSLHNRYNQLDIKFIKGDFTNQEIFQKGSLKDAKHLIFLYDESLPHGTPSDERTIIAAHNISYLKIKGKITLQLKDRKYLPNIRREKIQNVVIFDEVGGNLLATSTLNPSVPDFIQEALKFDDDKGFRETDIPSEFYGKTYRELFDNFREKKDLILLGIVSIQPEFSIEEVLSDDTSSIDQFIKRQFELSGRKLKKEDAKNYIKIKPADDYVIQSTDKAIVL
ncbi:potassium channel family protein [Candidatus Cloacimonadota bacterium]